MTLFKDELIKKMTTERLYNIFCMVRKRIKLRPSHPSETEIDRQAEKDDDDLFDQLKAELATREHLPRH